LLKEFDWCDPIWSFCVLFVAPLGAILCAWHLTTFALTSSPLEFVPLVVGVGTSAGRALLVEFGWCGEVWPFCVLFVAPFGAAHRE
jgi:hypothetical protein